MTRFTALLKSNGKLSCDSESDFEATERKRYLVRKRKIGVMAESFRLNIKEGIRKAADIGADGVQVYVVGGEVSSDMTRFARQEFKDFVAKNGLVISALCADYGLGLTNPTTNEEVVSKSIKCVDLAVDLGVTVITTHIGHLPDDSQSKPWIACYEAVCELAGYAERYGVVFATETGPEEAEVLGRFLDSIPSSGIGVNYDPANFIINGYECLEGVEILKEYIVHTHAKDAVYGKKGDYGREVPLNEGDVNFREYVRRLDAIGYDGFLTVEREVGDNPIQDIIAAVEFLREL